MGSEIYDFDGGCCVHSCCTRIKGIREQKPYSIASFYTDMNSTYDPSKTIDDWKAEGRNSTSFGLKIVDVQIKAVFSEQGVSQLFNNILQGYAFYSKEIYIFLRITK